MGKQKRLGDLGKGASGKIVSISGGGEFTQRIMEMGLLEGAKVQIVHEAPFGRDPIAVRVRGTLIALRRSEANTVTILLEE